MFTLNLGEMVQFDEHICSTYVETITYQVVYYISNTYILYTVILKQLSTHLTIHGWYGNEYIYIYIYLFLYIHKYIYICTLSDSLVNFQAQLAETVADLKTTCQVIEFA